MPGFLTRIGARVKSVSRMVFGRSSQLFGPGWGWAHGFSRSDYTTYTGDGSHNSIVQAQFRWITDNFPEAELRVRRRGAKGQLDPVDNHPLVELLDTPNPFYSSLTLFDATYREWRRGNAYWIVLKNLAGKPVQLWWAPSAMMEPVQGDDPSVFISHYDYRPRADQGPIRLEIGDVVHFRNGLDPKYPQKGSSDLDCLLREIFTDDEAASWSSSLLANGAGPHVMISPDDEADIDEDEAAKIKTNYAQKTTGDHRGEPLVMAGKTKIQIMSFNPSEMDYKSLRRVPEERISAVIGVPAVVCGLGAGLDRSTYNNMREAKEMATENVLIPAWRFFAREIQRQLLPQFADPRRDVFDFDLSTVRALQDDQNALWTRIDDALGKGGITLNQSLEMRGLDTIGPAGDVYYLPINVTPTTAAMIGDGSAPDPVPAPVAPPVDESIPKSFADALWDTLETKDGANYVQAIQRLRARLQMPFERQMAKYLSGQQSRVIAALRENLKRGYAHEIKAGEEVLDWNEEQRLLQALFDAAYRRALDGTHNVAQDVLGTSFEIDDPLTRAYLQQAGQNIVGITETTQRAIAHTLQEGQALGEGVDELMARIQRLGAFSEGRARVIARTELGQATNMATLTSFEASGVVVGVRVHDGTDHEPCAGLNGKTFTLEAVAALPPLSHPNCLVGGQLVWAPNLKASFTRWFDGEVVTLRTAADDQLTCTPNHPILTDRGWVAAGEIHEGDHVIRCLESEGVSRLLDPDHDHMPALIEQVADALGPTSGGTATSMPTSAEDFHGDSINGDIYVVRTNGLPEGRDVAETSDLVDHPAVVLADSQLPSLTGDRTGLQLLLGSLHATDSRMGGSSLQLAPLSADTFHLQAASFTGIAERVAVLSEPTTQAGSIYSDSDTDLIRRFASLVTPVEIVHIERSEFSGHVYNLDTTQKWYIANHIITHNCTRALAPLTRASQLRTANHNGHVRDLVGV